MRAPRLHYWQGVDRLWYWHLTAKNGATVLQGEGHRSRRDCVRALRRAQELMTAALIDADPLDRAPNPSTTITEAMT